MSLSGNPADYLLVFFAGVALSFTPCVYPLIPVSVGFIGADSAGSRLKGFFLSIAYASGVAVIYSLMGLIASLTGTFFGQISSNPLIRVLAGLVIILFGFSMSGAFIIPLPRMKRINTGGKGYFSAFLLGLVSGLVISPCVSPVLGAILVYLAAKKHLLYGVSLLFTFAYGMSLVLILAGTFSSVLTNLPASGKWMVYIKKICAFILIAAGIYFIYTAIGRW